MKRVLSLGGVIVASFGAQGCAGCITPTLPDDNAVDTFLDTARPDSGDTQDSAELVETDEPVDTSVFVVGCPQEEIEPNDTIDSAQEIVLEQWVCGAFDDSHSGSGADIDVFEFEMDEGGWLKVDVDAVVDGSNANPSLVMQSDEGEYLAVDREVSSNDPYAVFPCPEPDDWQIYLTNLNAGLGEEYDWQFLPTLTKQPFSYSSDCSGEAFEDLCVSGNEAEDGGDGNSTYATADELPVGEWQYGVFGGSSDLDIYTLTTTGEKLTYTWSIKAWDLGSPAQTRLVLRQDDDLEVDGYREISVTYPGGTGGLDPSVSYTSSEGVVETLYMTLREDNTRYGNSFWYLARLDVEGGDE